MQGALGADGSNQGPGPGRAPAGTPGPWDADVVVYRAGTDGKAEKMATFERAGVPTVARMKDGRLIAAHQYFPENDRENFDKVAIHFSADEGKTWTAPEVLRLKSLPGEMRYPFDPTLVALPDGRIRVYFTSLIGRRFEEHVPAIYSAISTNGVDYTFEPGMRFGVNGRFVIDCAVALHNGVFHLYSPDNGAQEQGGNRNGPPKMEGQEGVGYHATSTDGLNFTRQPDVKLDGRRRWLGNAQSDGKVIAFYGTGHPLDFVPTPGQRGGNLWMATSSDGQAWQLIKSPLVMGADPGAVTLKDGSLLVVTTGEPRPGTASANRMRGNNNNGGENFRPVVITPVMKALDVNNDGMLDAEELANATAALKTLDRDGNGRLSGDEFRAVNQGERR
ncbi:MAG TPA: hypothetical protein VGH19_15025 [Verrucomicrobiae bacterium]